MIWNQAHLLPSRVFLVTTLFLEHLLIKPVEKYLLIFLKARYIFTPMPILSRIKTAMIENER